MQSVLCFQISTTATTSSLHVPEVFLEDSGMFSVKAYNKFGQIQCKAKLTVVGMCLQPGCCCLLTFPLPRGLQNWKHSSVSMALSFCRLGFCFQQVTSKLLKWLWWWAVLISHGVETFTESWVAQFLLWLEKCEWLECQPWEFAFLQMCSMRVRNICVGVKSHVYHNYWINVHRSYSARQPCQYSMTFKPTW